MKFFKFRIDFILVLFFALLILVNPLTVEAYIDPGTGSFIIQAIIASIAVTGLYFKFFGRKIKSFFKYFSKKDKINKNDRVEIDSIDEYKQKKKK